MLFNNWKLFKVMYIPSESKEANCLIQPRRLLFKGTIPRDEDGLQTVWITSRNLLTISYIWVCNQNSKFYRDIAKKLLCGTLVGLPSCKCLSGYWHPYGNFFRRCWQTSENLAAVSQRVLGTLSLFRDNWQPSEKFLREYQQFTGKSICQSVTDGLVLSEAVDRRHWIISRDLCL